MQCSLQPDADSTLPGRKRRKVAALTVLGRGGAGGKRNPAPAAKLAAPAALRRHIRKCTIDRRADPALRPALRVERVAAQPLRLLPVRVLRPDGAQAGGTPQP